MSFLTDVHGRGLLSARPAAGHAGRLYYATDTTTTYRDNGSSWDAQSTGGIVDPTTTRGDLIVRGSSAIGRLAVGAANRALVSDGTDPAWGQITPAMLDVSADNTTANATSGHHGLLPKLSGSSSDVLRGDGTFGAAGGGSSGALILLASQAVAGTPSTIDFTTRTAAGVSGALIQADCYKYAIHVVGFKPGTSLASLALRFSTDGGSTWDVTGGHYAYSSYGWHAAGAGNNGSQSDSLMKLHSWGEWTGDANQSVDGEWIFTVGSASRYPKVSGHANRNFDGGSYPSEGESVMGTYLVATAGINAIRFLVSGGATFTDGIILIYGFKNS